MHKIETPSAVRFLFNQAFGSLVPSVGPTFLPPRYLKTAYRAELDPTRSRLPAPTRRKPTLARTARSRNDLGRPVWWSVSFSELNLAAELVSTLTRQLKQSWIHDLFLSWKQKASATTVMSSGGGGLTEWETTGDCVWSCEAVRSKGAAEMAQQAASMRSPTFINTMNSFIGAPPSGS